MSEPAKSLFMPKRNWQSPLRTRFIVSRRAYDLAGGRAPLLDLLASRVRGFNRDRRIGYDVSVNDSCVWSRLPGEGPGHRIRVFAPRDIEPPVNIEAELESYDMARLLFPEQDEPDFVRCDPLLHMHVALTVLIKDWPEVTQQMCAAKPRHEPTGALAEEARTHFEKAVEAVRTDGRASNSIIQLRLGVSYRLAAEIGALLEKRGIVTQRDRTGRRRMLIPMRSKE